MVGKVILIGGSLGAMPPLRMLVAALPSSLAAPIVIVRHIGAHRSALPEILESLGPLPAKHAEDGEKLVAGTIYVAPSDRHLLVTPAAKLQLTHGPKENFARPAIDPLFRSAALALGPAAIGVLLSGRFDDGVAGLQAVKAAGGTVVVQDPATAEEPDMPQSALRHVAVDHIAAPDGLAGILVSLLERALGPRRPAPPDACMEHEASNGGPGSIERLESIGRLSPFTCPDCGGSLWRISGAEPARYRCHTGHAYSSMVLENGQRESFEHALRSAMRALQQRERLLLERASDSPRGGVLVEAAARCASLAEKLRIVAEERL